MSQEDNKVQETAQEEVQISISDIELTRRVIALASERGAFKGSELSTVGHLYDKYAQFLKQNAPQEEESEEKGEAKQTEK